MNSLHSLYPLHFLYYCLTCGTVRVFPQANVQSRVYGECRVCSGPAGQVRKFDPVQDLK